MTKEETTLIIDASGLLYRSFFALPPLTSPSGEPTGALLGFVRSLLKVEEKIAPDSIVAVFDGPHNKRSRLALYSEYKATRKPTPPELIEQIKEAQRFCDIWKIPKLSEEGVEADDTIAAVVSFAKKKSDGPIYICSADKDLSQLISDRVRIINPAKDLALLDRDTIIKEWGVPPERLCDLFALVGDTSDNVPGVDGIGPKTAAVLLADWKDLDTLLENAEKIKGKKGERLVASKDLALLSRKLVSLDSSVPIPTSKTFYAKKEPDFDAALEFFTEKGFKSLMPLLAGSSKSPKPCSHKIVQTEKEFTAFLDWLSKQKEIGIDCETTSLDEQKAELVGIGIGEHPEEVFYINCISLSPEMVVKEIGEIISKKKISLIGHNIKYDLHILTRYGLPLPKLSFDTLVASWILHAHERNHSLDDLALRHFFKEKISLESLLGKGKKARSMKDVPVADVAKYCAEDIEYTLRLKELFEKELKEANLNHLFYDIEMPLIPILLKMEQHGVFVNKEKLSSLNISLDTSLNRVKKEIYKMAGAEFNINSPKQLSEILFVQMGLPKLRKGKKSLSTSAEILEELSAIHPIAGKILEYRRLEKLRSTYVEALPKQIDKKTGRVHCRFIQSGTATGRLACQDPNLQNIPIRSTLGKEIREAFQPQEPGWVYVSADYSQIELRLLAHFSKDPVLVKAFTEGLDIHAMTAAELFGLPLEKVTEDMRRRAKAVNFGIIYGQQAFGLAKELRIPRKEAQEFIDHYFSRYQNVQKSLDEVKEKAHKTGMAETLTGRRRLLPEINSSDFFIRNLQERLAVNTPFQGTSADIIKMAMIDIDSWLSENKLKTKMVLQIHDELIFETPKEELDLLIPAIRSKMEGVIELIVPLSVDISIGKNWKEC